MQTRSLWWVAYSTTRIIATARGNGTGEENPSHPTLARSRCEFNAAYNVLGISRATYYCW